MPSFKKIFTNKAILYVLSRYGTYVIQFINSLLIAIYLGPYYLGIWGFITLILNYFKQFDFGISHAVNAIIAIHKDKELYVQRIIGTALAMLGILSLLVASLFYLNLKFNWGIGNKFNFSTYGVVVCLIGIIGFYNSLMARVFRVYGRIIELAFNQSAFPILMLVAIIFFKDNYLLWALVGANFLAFLFSLSLYLTKTPVKLQVNFDWHLWKTLQIKGWHLFIYNTSFYLIIISTRTFVSSFYSVKEFGYFTFAFSLAGVFLLLLEAISSLIYPKLLNRMANSTMEKTLNILKLIRNSYITTSHFLIHIAIFAAPIFIYLLPQYKNSVEAFHLIALTIVLNTNAYGYSGLLIAKGKEKNLGYLSLLAFLINILAGLFIIKILHLPFSFAILSTMLSYFIYVFIVSKRGRKQMQLNNGLGLVIKDIFPLKLSLPYLVSLCLAIFKASTIYLSLPLILFLVLNYKTFKGLKSVFLTVISNSKAIDI